MAWIEHHRVSEQHASQAEACLREGKAKEAREHYACSAEIEERALRELDPSKIKTYGITAVSTASLYFKAGRLVDAERVAIASMGCDQLPHFARHQLCQLVQIVWAENADPNANLRLAEYLASRRAWQDVPLHESWKQELGGEFSKPYVQKLWSFLQFEKHVWGRNVYPEDEAIFAALNATPLDNVKVVIIGQDPYHGGQAHGLSFSVRSGRELPSSLKNIFEALKTDTDRDVPDGKGCLTLWAQQGVLLLNATLTVAAGSAGSHRCRGWETFTNRVVEVVNQKQQHVVFLLWGDDAKKKGKVVNRERHKVLEAPHPAVLRTETLKSFKQCRHFSQANEYLNHHGRTSIDWFKVC